MHTHQAGTETQMWDEWLWVENPRDNFSQNDFRQSVEHETVPILATRFCRPQIFKGTEWSTPRWGQLLCRNHRHYKLKLWCLKAFSSRRFDVILQMIPDALLISSFQREILERHPCKESSAALRVLTLLMSLLENPIPGLELETSSLLLWPSVFHLLRQKFMFFRWFNRKGFFM